MCIKTGKGCRAPAVFHMLTHQDASQRGLTVTMKRTLKAAGESTCTANGAHGYHKPFLAYTKKPNKPVRLPSGSEALWLPIICLQAGNAQN